MWGGWLGVVSLLSIGDISSLSTAPASFSVLYRRSARRVALDSESSCPIKCFQLLQLIWTRMVGGFCYSFRRRFGIFLLQSRLEFSCRFLVRVSVTVARFFVGVSHVTIVRNWSPAEVMPSIHVWNLSVCRKTRGVQAIAWCIWIVVCCMKPPWWVRRDFDVVMPRLIDVYWSARKCI